MKIPKFSNVVAGHSYYYVSIPNFGNWSEAKLVGPDKCKDLENYRAMVSCEVSNLKAKKELEQLVADIRILAAKSYDCSIKKIVDQQEKGYVDKEQQLWWVFAEYICHVAHIGIRAGKAKYAYMYKGNCFETKEQAEEFYTNLVQIFANYGITISKVENQFA